MAIISTKKLQELARLIRYYILVSTTAAGSGHPSSSLSATDLMATLMFSGFFRADLDNPNYPNNDRLIFSKGHAAPLLYSLYAAAGKVSEPELLRLRKFDSPLEGHPTRRFPYTEVATGSLGQGLSVGVGMAINAKYLDRLPYRTWVLLGDSEMAEGSVWEATELAVHYRLNNLVGIIDVNRLGQRGETMYGHHLVKYQKRLKAFGWRTVMVDGHNVTEIQRACRAACRPSQAPMMIIAKTLKGKGAALLENKEGWHGKPLTAEELKIALAGLGKIDKNLRGQVASPPPAPSAVAEGVRLPPLRSFDKLKAPRPFGHELKAEWATVQGHKGEGWGEVSYNLGDKIATRKAYGQALVRIAPQFPQLVALDAEVGNSTFAEIFKAAYPKRFFEMFIAEQNMVGVAVGFAARGLIPFASSFAAFFTRAHDQIRMSQYSEANIKLVGSHVGVSIGEDGPSQMGLEDLALFRSIHHSVVLYPADAVATDHLVEAAARHQGLVYIRTTRAATPVIYQADEAFPIGGSKTVRSSKSDAATVVAAGITLFEALKAYGELKKAGIAIRVIDLYSVKPLDVETLAAAARETKAIITVEDHYPEGGIGEAVAGAIENLRLIPTFRPRAQGRVGRAEGLANVISLAVRKMPKSGQPAELLAYEEIDAAAIVKTIKRVLSV